jgi:hypothetical protein
MVDYEVIKPEESQSKVGRSYQDLLGSWTTWFVSDNPDAHNYGNSIIFLRGLDFPLESTEKIGYSGQPAVMVGTRSLNISTDQYLFLPVINTFVINDGDIKTAQERRYIISRDTKAGDNPPLASQIKIDNVPLDPPQLFLTWSHDFVLHVPDVPYGRSLKDYIDTPLTVPGDFQANAAGWCILFRFTQPNTSHTVAFYARGILEPFGQYFASGIYTINVLPSSPQQKLPSSRGAPATIKQKLRGTIEITKQKNGLPDDDEYNRLIDIIDSL